MFSDDKNTAKEFLKLDRDRLIQELSSARWGSIPKNLDNIIFIANMTFINNHDIELITPEYIWNIIQQSEASCGKKMIELAFS